MNNKITNIVYNQNIIQHEQLLKLIINYVDDYNIDIYIFKLNFYIFTKYITNTKYRNLITNSDIDKNYIFDEENLTKIEEQTNIIKCINYIRTNYQILHDLFIDNLYILYMNINLTNLYEINVDPLTQIRT